MALNIVFVVCQTVMSCFVIWGLFHEDRLKAFERRIAESFRARRCRKAARELASYGAFVVWPQEQFERDGSCIRTVERWYDEKMADR